MPVLERKTVLRQPLEKIDVQKSRRLEHRRRPFVRKRDERNPLMLENNLVVELRMRIFFEFPRCDNAVPEQVIRREHGKYASDGFRMSPVNATQHAIATDERFSSSIEPDQ